MSDCGGDDGGDYGEDIDGDYGLGDGDAYEEDGGEIEDNYLNEEDECEFSDHCPSETSENYNHRQGVEIEVDGVDGIEYPGIGYNGAEAVIISGAYGSRSSEREGGGRRNYRNYESRDRRYIQPVAYHAKGMSSGQGKRHRPQQTSQYPSHSSYRSNYSQNTTNYSEEYQPNKRLQATSILTLIAGLVFIAVGVCLLTVIEHADPVILNIFGGTCIAIGVILLLVGFTLVIKHRACCGQSNSRVIVLSVPQDTVGVERSRPPHHDRMTRTNQPPVSAGGYSIRETDMIQTAVNPYYPPSAPNLPEEMHDQRNFARQNEKYIPYNGYPYVSPEITSPPPSYANIKQKY